MTLQRNDLSLSLSLSLSLLPPTSHPIPHRLALKAKQQRLTLEDKKNIQMHSDEIQHKGGIRRMLRDAELRKTMDDIDKEQEEVEKRKKKRAEWMRKRRQVLKRRRFKSAVAMQALMRRHLAKRRVGKIRAGKERERQRLRGVAVVRIQAFARGYAGRSKARERKKEVEEEARVAEEKRRAAEAMRAKARAWEEKQRKAAEERAELQRKREEQLRQRKEEAKREEQRKRAREKEERRKALQRYRDGLEAKGAEPTTTTTTSTKRHTFGLVIESKDVAKEVAKAEAEGICVLRDTRVVSNMDLELAVIDHKGDPLRPPEVVSVVAERAGKEKGEGEGGRAGECLLCARGGA